MAAAGLSDEQIFESLGISHETFYKHRNKNPEFDAAIKVGRARGILQVANALFVKATKGDTTAMIFFLKCRAKWNDRAGEIDDDAEIQARKIREALQAMDDMELGDISKE